MSSRGARAAMCAVLAACTPHPADPAIATPKPGIAIALYADSDSDAANRDELAIIDDRRELDVRGGELELATIDPGIVLSSLVIEPLAGPAALTVGACTRPLPAIGVEPPVVIRCQVSAPPGRYLVRLLYRSGSLHYRAEHDVQLSAHSAKISTRLTVDTAKWRAGSDGSDDGDAPTATVAIYDGVPGHGPPPLEIARGEIALAGSSAEIASAPRDLAVQIEAVVAATDDRARTTPLHDADPRLAPSVEYTDPHQVVMFEIELPGIHLARGPIHIQTVGADAARLFGDHELLLRDVAPTPRGAPTRLMMWSDDTLNAGVHRVTARKGSKWRETLTAIVANTSDAPRTVAIEHTMRGLPERELVLATPVKPTQNGDLLRATVTIPAHGHVDEEIVVEYGMEHQ